MTCKTCGQSNPTNCHEKLIPGTEQELPVDAIVVPLLPKRTLDPAQVATLAESIAIIGLQQPIIVDDRMNLIAGNHRWHAVRKLGWDTIRATVVPVNPLLNELTTIDENLMHKGLCVLEQCIHLQRREEILVELGVRATSGENQHSIMATDKPEYVFGGTTEGGAAQYAPPLSTVGKVTTKDIGREIGLAERTVRERLKIAREIPNDVKDRIRDTPIADNKSDLLRLVKIKGKDDQLKVAEMVTCGIAKTIKEAISNVTRDKYRQECSSLAAEVQNLPDTITLKCGDWFEYEETIPDNSIDCVFTDPPFIESWKENFAPFLNTVNRVLRPSGFAVFYCGHIRLPEVFEGLRECEIEFKDEALQFYWECALAHTGVTKAVHARNVVCGFKPIIILQKPPFKKTYAMFNDHILGSGRTKEHHDWEQSCNEILELLRVCTRPGDTVLDMFMGSGSTGVAAKMSQRRFLGYDIDTKNVQIARAKILEMENGERKRKE